MIIIRVDSWREKWSIPSCRALIWRSTCCLHTHALRCSLNSAAFQAESAQPGDHPLWDQSTEREGIWGARLSGLWGVIPQINMEIICKAYVPIMLYHFFSKTSWNLSDAMVYRVNKCTARARCDWKNMGSKKWANLSVQNRKWVVLPLVKLQQSNPSGQ